jgi:hypothetical protein
MVPKSHFQQVLPNDFVNAAFSFTALHWLQHTPSHGTEGDNAQLAASAHDGLVAFLSAHHRELRKDGTLTLCMPGQGPVGVQPVIECLEAAVRDLSSTYHFSSWVVAHLPFYFRTMDEILSAVSTCHGTWKTLGNEMVPMVHSAWASSFRSTQDKKGAFAGIGIIFADRDTLLGLYVTEGAYNVIAFVAKSLWLCAFPAPRRFHSRFSYVLRPTPLTLEAANTKLCTNETRCIMQTRL